MSRSTSLALALPLILSASNLCGEQIKPEAIDRGKSATVLVRISHEAGFTLGTAFCIDKSGLFLSTAGVVEKASAKGGAIGLIFDGGLKTQKVRRAKLLRQDEDANLALLEVAPQPGLTALDLGKDAALKELEEVYVLGYPMGNSFSRMLDAPRTSPAVTILPSRITALHKDGGRLSGFDLDAPIAPGNSGGPVLDSAGRVIGVVVASAIVGTTKPVIPVGRVAEFLAAPGLAFEPPFLTYKDRAQPVSWSIQVQPPTPGAALPENLSVAVTITFPFGDPRTFPAQPKGSSGVFEAKVIPVPQTLPRKVALTAWDGPRYRYEAIVIDDEVSVGNQKFRLSELRSLVPGPSPSVQTAKGDTVKGPISGLGKKVEAKVGTKTETVDLNEAPRLGVTYLQPPPPVSKIDILVEARQGSKTLVRLRRQLRLDLAAPAVAAAPAAIGNKPGSVPASGTSFARGDERLRMGGDLDVDGVTLGAGKSIRPPRINRIGAARLEKGAGGPDDAPYVYKLINTITDLAVGGGGRYLLLTLKQADSSYALGVFDVNLATLLKRIPLSSPNTLVAAGAKRFLIASPDENQIQCWDLATLQPLGERRTSPIDGRLKSLAIGSDSDGPALAFWGVGPKPYGNPKTWHSLIDLDSLDVLRIGSIVSGGSGHLKGVGSLSPSNGAFAFLTYVGEQSNLHIRASAGGALFGMWDSSRWPSGFHTLSMYGGSLIGTNMDDPFAHVVPGPDGRTVYTGLAGRLDPSGTAIGTVEPSDVTIPTSDPLYYLAIAGLNGSLPNQPRPVAKPGSVTASIHATGDGARLLTVLGLDEMAGLDRNDLFATTNFTIDDRFHLVPAANLLITIPPENDRLVMRRLDLGEALDKVGGDYLAVAALPALIVTPGQKVERTIVARSKAGGLTYSLANGPKGLSVTPEGGIVWQVPKDLKHTGEELSAIVSVGDRSGKELFLTLKIRVK